MTPFPCHSGTNIAVPTAAFWASVHTVRQDRSIAMGVNAWPDIECQYPTRSPAIGGASSRARFRVCEVGRARELKRAHGCSNILPGGFEKPSWSQLPVRVLHGASRL